MIILDTGLPERDGFVALERLQQERVAVHHSNDCIDRARSAK